MGLWKWAAVSAGANRKTDAAYALLSVGMLLSFLLPWHVHPLRSYYHELSIISGMLLSLACLAWLARGQKLLLHVPTLIVFPVALLFIIAMDVSSPYRTTWFDALIPAQYFLLMGVALILGATLTATERGREDFCVLVASVFLIAGVLSFLMQLIQVAGIDVSPMIMYLPFTQTLGRPYANIAQPNQLALLFCFALAGVWYLFKKNDVANHLTKSQSFLVALCLIVGIALTQSRIGWIILPLFTIMLIAQNRDSPRRQQVAIVALLCLYFVIVFLLPLMTASVGMSGGNVAEHVGGRSERKGLWLQAWTLAQMHPWRGVGWFGFGAGQVQIAADFSSSTYAEHAHNLILNFAAEIGWPLTLTLSVSFAWWFWQSFIAARKLLPLQFSGMCLLAALVHSMVEFPLWYAYILLPIALLMGMQHQLRWPTRVVALSPKLVISVVVLAFACIGYMTWDYQRVVAGFNVLRWEPTPSAAGLKKLEKPLFTLYPQFFDYFKLMEMDADEGMSAKDIAFAEKWTPRFGFVHILNKLAEIHVLNGESQKAVREMQTLQRLHPDAYPEYFDYWKAKSALDSRYAVVFAHVPPRDSP